MEISEKSYFEKVEEKKATIKKKRMPKISLPSLDDEQKKKPESSYLRYYYCINIYSSIYSKY